MKKPIIVPVKVTGIPGIEQIFYDNSKSSKNQDEKYLNNNSIVKII